MNGPMNTREQRVTYEQPGRGVLANEAPEGGEVMLDQLVSLPH